MLTRRFVATLAGRPVRAVRAPRVVLMAAKPAGGHEHVFDSESDFDKETANLAVRMLTARAAGIVLQNISQVDTFRAAWLQEHIAQNPPIEGNAFLTQLMNTKPVYSVDPYSQQTLYINPAQIAAAVLATREQLAQKLAGGLVRKVADANVRLMRTHLETHTYVSGSSNDAKPSYRQYRKRSSQQHKQPLT